MVIVFNILTGIIDVILYPFRHLPPFWPIAFLSLLSAIFILLIYKAVSNQQAIKQLKKRIQAYFLGTYLFRDDAGQILRTQLKLLASIMRYLGHSFPPLLVVIVPILLLCAQMQLRFGYRSPQPGDEVRVSVKLAPECSILQTNFELRVPDGISVLTPALRIGELHEVDWKVRVDREGNFDLTFDVGDAKITKRLSATGTVNRLYPQTGRKSFWTVLSYPGESPLDPRLPVLAVSVAYPQRRINVVGLHLHWVIIYFVLAVIFGFFLKRPFNVDF